MTLQERINALVQLGAHLKGEDDFLEAIIKQTQFNNRWFTIDNQHKAIAAIAEEFLNAEKLNKWTSRYTFDENHTLYL